MNELHLFAGAGGGILAGQSLGHTCVCAVEWEPYAAAVLAQRQNDGLLPPFPIWDDVRTFDGRPWRGIVDVVAGGFPCQDISVAGKGAGITGERSGMWSHMARIVGEVRPALVYVENSPALLTRGLGVVLGDLAALGYDCRWTVLGAADVGAPHQRDRFWLVAHAVRDGQQQPEAKRFGAYQCNGVAEAYSAERREIADAAVSGGADVADSDMPEGQRLGQHGGEVLPDQEPVRFGGGSPYVGNASSAGLSEPWAQQNGADWEQVGRPSSAASWWSLEPDVGRVAHGVAARVDRLKAIGNGQVPACAAAAWRLLTEAA